MATNITLAFNPAVNPAVRFRTASVSDHSV
jgi:hypothetical protein